MSIKAPCVKVSGGTQQACTNEPVKIYPINVKKRVIAKVPVVLAEIDVQVDVFSTIALPEEALEIKEVTKKLKLTQCRLIQTFKKKHKEVDWDKDWDKGRDKDWDNDCDKGCKEWDKDWGKDKMPVKFKLFLEGFVRKNIQYSVVDCRNKFGVCGDIRHCSVDVPISCVTTIKDFNGSPPLPVIFNRKKEFEFVKSVPLHPEKDQLLLGDLPEFNQCSFEYFNELPFCELVSSSICEHDELLNLKPVEDASFEDCTFKEFSEKMVIELTLKILQKQQVHIPPFHWEKRSEDED